MRNQFEADAEKSALALAAIPAESIATELTTTDYRQSLAVEQGRVKQAFAIVAKDFPTISIEPEAERTPPKSTSETPASGQYIHPSQLIEPVPAPKLSPVEGYTAISSVGASDNFIRKVASEYEELPEGTRRIIEKNGVSIVVAGKLSDWKPELLHTRPPGYPEGLTPDHSAGVTSEKTSVIAETVRSGSGYAAAEDTDHTFRHELGHAIDKAIGAYSETAEFSTAYAKDVSTLTPHERAELAYFLQSYGRGQSETFAEIACAELGCEANPTVMSKFMYSRAAVKAKLERSYAEHDAGAH